MTFHVVVGLDGSPHANIALAWAVSEAEVHDGQVTAVFARDMPWTSNPAAFEREDMEVRAKQFLLDTVAHVVPEARVPIQHLVAQGDISGALIGASRGADMPVLGSRGRGGFSGLLLGSVSHECVMHAQCPVVVIKQPAPD